MLNAIRPVDKDDQCLLSIIIWENRKTPGEKRLVGHPRNSCKDAVMADLMKIGRVFGIRVKRSPRMDNDSKYI